MATGWITINAVQGSTIVGNPLLFGRTILKVKREGQGYEIVYNPVALAAASRRVMHITNKLTFTQPFNASEKIYVLIKNL